MKKALEIHDHDENNILAGSLAEFLELVPSGYQDWVWRLFDLEAVSRTGFNVMAVSDAALSRPEGVILSWQNLTHMAANLFQEINLILVAAEDESTLRPPPCDREFYDNYAIVIECVDSSLWQVTTSDSELVGNIYSHFNKVVEVALG